MPVFSPTSAARLATAHPDLQRLFNAVVVKTECAVLCGHRGEAEQHAAFEEGNSKLDWPLSAHNTTPSNAVDAAPLTQDATTGLWRIDWQSVMKFCAFSVVVKDTATQLGIKVVWGGDWQHFRDYDHWQRA